MNDISREIIKNDADNPQALVNLSNSNFNYYGTYWGFNGTLIICKEIMDGWDPKEIKINFYDSSMFNFDSIKSGKYGVSQKGFDKYYEKCSPEIKASDFDRWMLHKYSFNPKSKNKMELELRKTKWSHLNYIWHNIMNEEKTRKEEIENILGINKSEVLPNSFSLHLVILTKNNEIVLTEISKEKLNDYPSRYAASLGEQLEAEDFKDGTVLFDNFAQKWVKRALCEELALDSIEYEEIVDKNSIKVLSLNLETDIINFSICTVVKLHIDFEGLVEHCKLHSYIVNEISGLTSINYKEIPSILLNKHTRISDLHPSTQLRLLLTLFHLKGFNKAMKMVVEENK